MRLSSPRYSRISLKSPRKIRVTTSSFQTPNVFANSLQKTLDAHRTSNRARLVRKVYPRTPAAGLWRPEIPLESRPQYQQATPLATADNSTETIVEATPGRRRRDLKNRDDTVQPTPNRHEDTLIRGSEYIVGDCYNARNSPWLSYMSTSDAADNATTFLNWEILALEQYLTPTSQEQACINQLSTQVIGILNQIVPHKPQLIGSRQIGLAIPHSDLNFFLLFDDMLRSPDRLRKPSPTRPQIQDAHLDLLRQIETPFKQDPSFANVQISGKRRPVLGARHKPTGLLLRLHCGESTPEIMKFMRNYLIQYPTLHSLYVATRALLEARGIFGSAHAGIRPDALIMLLVAFLKLNHDQISVPLNVAEQFLAFLRFYGTEVELQSLGVSVEPPELFGLEKTHEADQGDVESSIRRGQRSLINAKRTAVSRGNLPAGQRLCIQDPTHHMNDLGRSCIRTAELQNVFATAYQQLCDATSSWSGAHENKPSILGAALRADFDPLNAFRERLVSPKPASLIT